MPKLDRRMQPKSSSSELLKNQQTNILHHQRGAARSVKIKGDVSSERPMNLKVRLTEPRPNQFTK